MLALAAAAALTVASLAADTSAAPPDTTVPPATANPFLPDDTSVNPTDCISALPRPECGSEERSDWRQYVVFGVMVGGLAVIGTTIVIQMRRRRPTEDGRADR